MNRDLFRKLAAAFFVTLVLLWAASNAARLDDTSVTRYLAFQIFTGAQSPHIAIGGSGTQPLSPPPSKSAIKALVQDIVGQIGMTGDDQTKLAFILGPLAFDHTDTQLRQIIEDGFDIALELDVAVGFHIDDSMFWARRTDLWQDPQNIEWVDWEQTPNTGRRLDWSAEPLRIAPQMCFNSPAIEAEVNRLAAEVIGSAIQQGIRQLEAAGRSELFAGVIVGWETQIGRDFATNQWTGYCALSNRGFSADHLPDHLDAERERAVQAFIELWAAGIQQAGVDPAKIYAHTAVVPQTVYDSIDHSPDMTYSQMNQFAPPEVAFGTNYQPGFSTYPQAGLMEQLYDELSQHGSPAWASAEGSPVAPSMLASVVSMETYLAWMFNHGAALVNIFGWGIGVKSDNPFWSGVDNPEAHAAYRKFLRGEPLIATAVDLTLPVTGSLPGKIQRIQRDLPAWLQQHPAREAEITTLMQQLDTDLKDNRLQDASETTDMILSIIGQ